MPSKPKITDRDKGWKDLRAELKRLKDKSAVLVGLQGAEGSAEHGGSGLTNAHLGAIHEFGLAIERKSTTGKPYTITIPERSFLRATLDAKREEYAELAKRLGGGIVDRRFTSDQALELLGMRVVADVQNRISDGIPPPNEPATARRKGSTKPLIDTGQLRQSITYVVRRAGESKVA